MRFPARRIGPITIDVEHETDAVPIVGFRSAMLTGRQQCSVRASKQHPIRIHRLREKGIGTWMTDSPEELQQVEDFLYRAKPQRGQRMCVGGLGLGIVATRLTQLGAIVTAVERRRAIIHAVAGWTTAARRRQPYRVICSDIAKYLRRCEPFDAYYLDTWQGTSENTWWSNVLPLRRLIGQRFGVVPIYCWAEDMMLGQVVASIRRTFDHEAATGTPRHWHMAHLPADTDVLRFVGPAMGTPAWEAQYGTAVDRMTL